MSTKEASFPQVGRFFALALLSVLCVCVSSQFKSIQVESSQSKSRAKESQPANDRERSVLFRCQFLRRWPTNIIVTSITTNCLTLVDSAGDSLLANGCVCVTLWPEEPKDNTDTTIRGDYD